MSDKRQLKGVRLYVGSWLWVQSTKVGRCGDVASTVTAKCEVAYLAVGRLGSREETERAD